jgi:SAM-dependent methyltransferase
MSTAEFYDDLAEYYDLIYADWGDSMLRQGQAIVQILRDHLPERGEERLGLLDVAAGIGTQALPLAQLGHRVTARDLSAGAINRLSREARERDLSIDAAAADMLGVSETVDCRFDSVLCMDNSLPHLLTDSEISAALSQFRELLVPGGLLLLSVRDYAKVDRSPKSTHLYGERRRGSRKFRLGQTWEWLDPSHYRTTFLIEEAREGGWEKVCETHSTYYAIAIPRLLELMEAAGFVSGGQSDSSFFQPVLAGPSRSGGWITWSCFTCVLPSSILSQNLVSP